MTEYKQSSYDFWSGIPNFSGIRVFPNGLDNVRLGGGECRAIIKQQMFVNHALFPLHGFFVENNILLCVVCNKKSRF